MNSVFEGFMPEPCLLQPCFHVAGPGEVVIVIVIVMTINDANDNSN